MKSDAVDKNKLDHFNSYFYVFYLQSQFSVSNRSTLTLSSLWETSWCSPPRGGWRTSPKCRTMGNWSIKWYAGWISNAASTTVLLEFLSWASYFNLIKTWRKVQLCYEILNNIKWPKTWMKLGKIWLKSVKLSKPIDISFLLLKMMQNLIKT